ncbi:MAG: type II secretion system protein GspG [Pseudomonadota bacterium]
MKPGFYAALLLCVLASVSCSTTGIDKVAYQQRLIKTLPNQRDVSFSDDAVYPGGVWCGSYTSLSGNGFTTETKPFVVTKDKVLRRTSDKQRFVYCNSNPLGALAEAYGLDVSSEGVAQLATIVDDFASIDRAITSYHYVRNTMPVSLEDLVNANLVANDAVVKDPWGRQYVFKAGLAGRTTPRYQLKTLGADGLSGGKGSASDIVKEDAPAIQHALANAG